MEGRNINNTEKKGVINTYRRSNVFLALGILCYIIVGSLFLLQNKITSSTILKKLSSFLAVIADYLWSAPSAIIATLILLSSLWFYYHIRTKAKPRRHLKWFIHLPSFTRFSLLSLFFIYSLLPLRWAQRGFTRSLESFPDYTSFNFILLLLSLAGTILCCLYCFEKLPLKIIILIENLTSRFFKWKASSFIGSLLILSLLTTGTIAYVVLDHIPHVEDSIAQLFQAKIFKMGKLYAPLPPHKEFFDYTNIVNDDKWYSQYLPGHPLLLMLGLFLGIPWLIGPLLGTLSLLVFFLVIKNIYSDHRVLYLSCILLLLSPFFLFMSSNYMNHSSTMFFMLLFLYFYLRMFSSNSCLYAIISGLSLGYAVNIRPLTAVAIGTPFICYSLICAYKKREIQVKKVVCLFMAISSMVFLLLLYNSLTNGNPFLFGYEKNYQTLGFLGSSQLGPPHTLKGGVINTSNNLIGLNQYLFEWPIPSLIFIFILFALPARKNRWEYMFLVACGTVILGYFFYWYQDLCFGPRFYYSLMSFMIIFTVRGFLELPNWLGEKGFDRRSTEVSLYLLVLFCFLYTFSFSLPLLIKKYSNDYWWVTDKIHKTVEKQGITKAIVFIDVWRPLHITKPNLIPYGSGFQFNSPDLNDDVIYAMDLKDRNSELMKAFPNRHYYLCKIYSPMSGFKLLKLNGRGNH
jgi:hypothetical protein